MFSEEAIVLHQNGWTMPAVPFNATLIERGDSARAVRREKKGENYRDKIAKK